MRAAEAFFDGRQGAAVETTCAEVVAVVAQRLGQSVEEPRDRRIARCQRGFADSHGALAKTTRVGETSGGELRESQTAQELGNRGVIGAEAALDNPEARGPESLRAARIAEQEQHVAAHLKH